MHAHVFPTQERTLAPSQNLRGVAGTCAPVAGFAAPSFALRGSLCPAPRRSDTWYPWPGMAIVGSDSKVDFGSLVGGGPV